MAKYICVNKCRHDRRYDPGDIAEFPDGAKVPAHFKLIEEPKEEPKPKKQKNNP